MAAAGFGVVVGVAGEVADDAAGDAVGEAGDWGVGGVTGFSAGALVGTVPGLASAAGADDFSVVADSARPCSAASVGGAVSAVSTWTAC